ncbi:MAG: hypothetical protein C4346_15335 [Chloroflexota bacterium]
MMRSLATILVWAGLSAFAVLIVLALAAGLWIYAAVGVFLTSCYAIAAPYVLHRRWRPAPPPPARRPVRRRRR